MWQEVVTKQTVDYTVQEAERRGKTRFFNPLGGYAPGDFRIFLLRPHL